MTTPESGFITPACRRRAVWAADLSLYHPENSASPLSRRLSTTQATA